MSSNGKFHTRNQWTEEFESHLAASLAVCLLRGILNYGLYLSFPLYVAMMVVGSIHREECPVNKRIPWYLILGKTTRFVGLAQFIANLQDTALLSYQYLGRAVISRNQRRIEQTRDCLSIVVFCQNKLIEEDIRKFLLCFS